MLSWVWGVADIRNDITSSHSEGEISVDLVM